MTALWRNISILLLLTATSAAHQKYKRHGGGGGNNRVSLSAAQVDIKDKIIELQCYGRCSSNATQQCRDKCQKDLVREPRRGHCPSPQQSDVIFPPHYRLACLYNCQYDFDCADVQRCCGTACGQVCIQPLDLRNDALLPPIPKIVKCEIGRNHKAVVTVQSSANSTYYMHVEVRHHIGVHFAARKLGPWQWQPVEKLAEFPDRQFMKTEVRYNLRPSRFYQVRVAAVNGYGFRGYSEPATINSTIYDPKPPKAPADVKVAMRQFDGKFYSVRVVWCPSKSNLPVEKYKVIWSLYVRRSKDESMISHEAYVKDAHQFKIMKLLPNSSYYIQVQAIAINGNRRLKSDKQYLLYTTTERVPSTPYSPLQCSSNGGQQTPPHGPHPYRVQYNNDNADAAAATPPPDDAALPSRTAITTKTLLSAAVKGQSNQTTQQPTAPPLTGASNAVASMVVPYEVRFRLNRKFGMLAQISGLPPQKETVFELCPKATKCEQHEYNAIRAKVNSLEFSKLKYNTTYELTVGSNSSSAYTFTTPKCENFRKRFPKMQIKC